MFRTVNQPALSGETLGLEDLIGLTKDRCVLCLTCSDFDHLLFLRSGNTALIRRARKYSTLAAVVLKRSSARKRNERQGVLVEMQALVQAEEECLADSEVRAQKREREAVRGDELDYQYMEQFAKRVWELFPGRPAGQSARYLNMRARNSVAVLVGLHQPGG